MKSGEIDLHEDSKLAELLRALPALPKAHYAWPLSYKISEDLLYEYVRLSRSTSLSGEWATQDDIAKAVAICKRVNLSKPKITTSIAVNYSPWHRVFGKTLPPSDVGPTHVAELARLRTRLQFIKDTLDVENMSQGTNIEVSTILYDCERFRTSENDDDWNNAITEKLNAAYAVAKEVLGSARVEWYGRGAIIPSASATGWSEFSYSTKREEGVSFSCPLYQVPEIENTHETYRRTENNAVKHGVAEIIPWVALAAGYRRNVNDNTGAWDGAWDYDIFYSWMLGAEINQWWYGHAERGNRFAPWRKAPFVVFYPAPFNTPEWGKHFVAYARGAAGVKEQEPTDMSKE